MRLKCCWFNYLDMKQSVNPFYGLKNILSNTLVKSLEI